MEERQKGDKEWGRERQGVIGENGEIRDRQR